MPQWFTYSVIAALCCIALSQEALAANQCPTPTTSRSGKLLIKTEKFATYRGSETDIGYQATQQFLGNEEVVRTHARTGVASIVGGTINSSGQFVADSWSVLLPNNLWFVGSRSEQFVMMVDENKQITCQDYQEESLQQIIQYASRLGLPINEPQRAAVPTVEALANHLFPTADSQ